MGPRGSEESVLISPPYWGENPQPLLRGSWLVISRVTVVIKPQKSIILSSTLHPNIVECSHFLASIFSDLSVRVQGEGRPQ